MTSAHARAALRHYVHRDRVLLQRINVAAETERRLRSVACPDTDPPHVRAARTAKLAELEDELDRLYAKRRRLRAQALALLSPSSRRPTRRR